MLKKKKKRKKKKLQKQSKVMLYEDKLTNKVSYGEKENEIVGWYHQVNGHEFEQTLGDSAGREAWRATVQSCTLLNNNSSGACLKGTSSTHLLSWFSDECFYQSSFDEWSSSTIAGRWQQVLVHHCLDSCPKSLITPLHSQKPAPSQATCWPH